MAGEYDDHARAMRDKLNAKSPSLCIAKWAQVSINLPAGLTQSCYHPPTHPIPLVELAENSAALHNTVFKIHERKQMLEGIRPEGCSYCWKIEDAGHLSDRAYRSSEWWAETELESLEDTINDVTPRYVEVNFNQACNFKCIYCSPHLSTTWEEEIKKFGPYQVNGYKHNDLNAIQRKGIMPLKVANKDNPYVIAFWEWWPVIYRKLRVFRMTGGEPLMDKNTFKVLDYVNKNPHGQLELSITSNLCPPDQKLFDKFITAIKKLEEVRTWEDKENFNEHSGNYWYVAPAHKHFTLFVSLDGVGKQAEYMRNGLDYNRLLDNVRMFLRETKFTSVSFINTFNILSIPSFTEFVKMILALRQEFGGRMQDEVVIPESEHNGVVSPSHPVAKFQRIWFDVPVLEYPYWLSIQNATQLEVDSLKESIAFMKENAQKDDYLNTFEGIKPYEIEKVERNLALIGTTESKETNKVAFYEFVKQVDARRGTTFYKVFPKLNQFYLDCLLAFKKARL